MVLVGENPASDSCALNKTRAAAEVGVSSETTVKTASVSEEELLNLIHKPNSDDHIDGLLVQLPLSEKDLQRCFSRQGYRWFAGN